jgi:hypothetical protein
MHNLLGYLFLTESILAVARTLKGTLIIHDGYNYHIDVEMLKYCIGNAKDELTCAKFVYSLIHALTNQNKLNLTTTAGDIVGTITWNEKEQTYIQC